MSCQGVCEPGEVMVGEECGGCGLKEQLCNDDCEWEPTTCVEHTETCAFWRLSEGATEWQRFPLYEGQQAPKHAPTQPVLAAADISARKEAYIFTQSSYHVLQTQTLTWVRSGQLADHFAKVAGKQILAAYATPDGEGGNMKTGRDGLTFITPTAAYNYTIVLQNAVVAYENSVACCDDLWTTKDAPATQDVRALWIAIDDATPWVDVTLDACENAPEGTPLTWYGATITDETVHLQDIGYCFDFHAQLPFSQWYPFSLPGAPEKGTDVGAGFLNEGDVWVFRGP